jgi:hypothetical protein
MSGAKTVARPQHKTNDRAAGEQQCSKPAVCCEKIREVAYYKWEAAGCPCSDGVEFWLEAEAQLAADAEIPTRNDEPRPRSE